MLIAIWNLRWDLGKLATVFFFVADDNTNEVIRLVRNAFAYTLQDAILSTTSWSESAQNNFLLPKSAILRLLSRRDGDLSTYFDLIDGIEGAINISSMKYILNKLHRPDNRDWLRDLYL